MKQNCKMNDTSTQMSPVNIFVGYIGLPCPHLKKYKQIYSKTNFNILLTK